MNAKSLTALSVAVLSLVSGTAAHAATAASNKVFISGPLILIFLGFCALVVIAQIIPVISTLYGMIKGLRSSKEKVTADVKAN
jgi:hypothetical protein